MVAHLEGPNLNLLIPTESHNVKLLVPGGSPVPSVQGYGGDDAVEDNKLPIQFDRVALINSIQAGISVGQIQPNSLVPIELSADGFIVGKVLLRTKGLGQE